jgi:hypothetical protein
MHCGFCQKQMAYIHGHLACVESSCPFFGKNQGECCDGETAESSPAATTTLAAARPLSQRRAPTDR